MADTYTANLKIRKPATGTYPNTWGSVLNSDMMELFDAAIAGQSTISVGASIAFSMPAMSQGAASDSRAFCIHMTGTPGSSCTVTMPGSVTGKFYLVDNQTGQNLVFTYGGGGGTVTVADAEKRLIWCDGVNCQDVLAGATDAASLGGIPAAYWARVRRTPAEVTANTMVRNQFEGVMNSEKYVEITEHPTTVVDASVGNSQHLVLTGNRTMGAPTNPVDGAYIDLLIEQDGTGGRTLTWNAIFLFENGVAPTLASAPGGFDRFLMKYNAAKNKWVMGHFGSISTPSGATYSFTLTDNQLDWNLAQNVGSVGGAVTVNVTIAPGTVIEASSSITPAMDLSGLPSGSTVNLTNFGYILGHGGDGANGGFCLDFANDGIGFMFTGGQDGETAGPAIKGPGASRTFNITNAAGHIWGGGGGGGGGGLSVTNAGSGDPNMGSSGGGGGGAGGGSRGQGGTVGAGNTEAGAVHKAGNGQRGGGGVNGSFGAGGAGTTHNSGAGSAGGAGGDWGADGADGVANTTFTVHIAAGSGGNAGKAIELSGAAAPTFLSGSGAPNVRGAVT